MVQPDASMGFSGAGNVQLGCKGNGISVVQHVGKVRILSQRLRDSDAAVRDTYRMLYAIDNTTILHSDDIVTRCPL